MVAEKAAATVFKTIEGLVQGGVGSGLFTHAMALYGRLDEKHPRFAYRHLPEGRDIFDLASMTKALVTTPLVFRSLLAQGFDVEVTVGRWLGASRVQGLDPRLCALTVRSLLAHISGLPSWRNFWMCHLGVESPETLRDPQMIRERLMAGLNRAAGHLQVSPSQVYSDVGFLLLGFCLTELEARPLRTLFFEMLVGDLKLDPAACGLWLGVPGEKISQAVPTAYCEVRRYLLMGEVHDENAASLGGVQGHAGLFGAAEAVAAYLCALADSPLGRDVLQRNAAALVLPPGDPPNESLLGWRQGADASSYPFAEGGAMGHMGFTGVAFWVCPRAQDYAILLTNRVWGGRTRAGIAAFRQGVFSALAQLRP